jgi:UDP-N-acetylmuramoyl-tripeptide--D-alanyl-D-alanine ligase
MAAVWGEITAKEVFEAVRGILISGKKQTRLAGISTDSRRVSPGDIFLALKGERYDGHDFVFKSLEQGAAGIVVQGEYWKRESAKGKGVFGNVVAITVPDTLKALGDLAGWWRRQHDAKVVAITGSSGKTTTKEMTATILELANSTLKNQGNLNNLIGLPLTLLRLEKRHDKAVLEMGMNRPGEIARLTEISNPYVGAITNIGRAHLEGLGDLEGVARAKVELVEKISSSGKITLNGDDELLLKTASMFRKEMTTFGLGKTNDIRAINIQNLGRKGILFDLEYSGKTWPVRLRTPGLQNVLNALAAASVCLCLNEPVENILEGLGRFEGVKGRFMIRSLPGDIILIDDTYNSNPSSLTAALESVKALVNKGMKIIVGLGEMMELGDTAEKAHLEAGRKIAEFAPDCFTAIGEHARDMIKGAVEAGMPKSRAKAAENHDEMLRIIKGEMSDGCLIFLKGSRKMALEKVVKGLKSAGSGMKRQLREH